MAKKNAMCIELLYSDELSHAETSAAKRNYNREYYQAHKQYWKDYYKTGHGIGRGPSAKPTSTAQNRVEGKSEDVAARRAKLYKDRENIQGLISSFWDDAFNYDLTSEQRAEARRNYDKAVKKRDAIDADLKMLEDISAKESVSYSPFRNPKGKYPTYRAAGKIIFADGNSMDYPSSASGAPYAKIKDSERKYKKSGGGGRW